ncbi:MAG: tRNA lysidine(34) synthetase TilS [Planctomycetes bacterium RBG_13_63_9]|nr:MAG: tRNA lysidine(34) synthetase TilS [Planctomycetes bacterium RBG_13_63_9]
MPNLHSAEERLAAAWPPEAWCDVTVLLAVSGGADSVALLRAINALRTGGQGRIVVAHFNHRFRGDESSADEQFVVDLCGQLQLPCELGCAQVGVLAAHGADGLEAAARAARYRFLEQTAARLGARYVVTAHTADDQAETILHRIMRGTGVAGLAGMARARPLGPAVTLIRPLLGLRRSELVAYLDDLGQPYRSDSSNDDTLHTRNRIRHDLLPRLAAQYNPGVVDALLRLGTLAAEVQGIIDSIVADLAERCVTATDPAGVEIDAAVLGRQPRYVVRELLMAIWRGQGWPMQAMGYAQWDLLAEMISATRSAPGQSTSKQTFPGNIMAEATPDRLRLRRAAS